MTFRVRLTVGALLLSAAVLVSAPLAAAEPAPPPGPGSTDEELTDMVLDALESGPAAPSTTPVVPIP